MSDRPAINYNIKKEIRLGIAGLGTVGASLVQLIAQRAEQIERQLNIRLKIVGLSARDKQRDRGFDPGAFTWYENPIKLAVARDVDIFVELIGGAEGVANASIRAALNNGAHVVTANKALLAHSGMALAILAESLGREISFEAAVAGGVPVIKTLRESLIGHKINKIHAIVNGTCNYILSRMQEQGVGFAEALQAAQKLGYAEACPKADVQGFDAAQKLALLTALAFKKQNAIENVVIRGIDDILEQDIRAVEHFGYRLKLLASCLDLEDGVLQIVEPTLLPKTSLLAQLSGVVNGVTIFSDLLGELFLAGPGAGGSATAAAVLADILDLAIKQVNDIPAAPLFGVPIKQLEPYKKADLQHQLVPGFYIRLCVADQTGIFADVSQKMAKNNVSFESIAQNLESLFPGDTEYKNIVIITHETTRQNVEKALDAIAESGYLCQKYRLYPLALL